MTVTVRFSLILHAFILSVCLSQARADEITLHVYGPGGPAPAMKCAASQFAQLEHLTVDVTAGPPDTWINPAKSDADLIFSGSEGMMDEMIHSMGGELDGASIQPLYVRPLGLLVRPGNPLHIHA